MMIPSVQCAYRDFMWPGMSYSVIAGTTSPTTMKMLCIRATQRLEG